MWDIDNENFKKIQLCFSLARNSFYFIEITNIRFYYDYQFDIFRTPFCLTTLSLAQSSKPKSLSASRLTLPRPPDDIPRSFYENLPTERKDSLNGLLPDINIGPPPNFAPPLPPGKPK